jgi:hypothetical protein
MYYGASFDAALRRTIAPGARQLLPSWHHRVPGAPIPSPAFLCGCSPKHSNVRLNVLGSAAWPPNPTSVTFSAWTLLCAYLAGTLLVGLLGNAAFGAWWLDPVVALLIAAVAVREGIESWRGEGCCASSPLDGVGFADDDCKDDCCHG